MFSFFFSYISTSILVSCYKNPTIRARRLLSTLIVHLGDRDYRIIHVAKRPNLPLEWILQLYVQAALYENEKNRRDGEAGERSLGWLSGLNQSSSCSCFSHPVRRRYQAPSPFSRKKSLATRAAAALFFLGN